MSSTTITNLSIWPFEKVLKLKAKYFVIWRVHLSHVFLTLNAQPHPWLSSRKCEITSLTRNNGNDLATFFTVLRLVWMILYFYVIITRHVLKAAAQVIRDRNQSPCSVRHSDNPETGRPGEYQNRPSPCKSSCGREQRHRQGWHRHVPVGFGFYLVIAISHRCTAGQSDKGTRCSPTTSLNLSSPTGFPTDSQLSCLQFFGRRHQHGCLWGCHVHGRTPRSPILTPHIDCQPEPAQLPPLGLDHCPCERGGCSQCSELFLPQFSHYPSLITGRRWWKNWGI